MPTERPNKVTEIQLQAKCWKDFWNKFPSLRRCLFHVPNGGSRNKIEAMQLQASGVVPGVQDILFIFNGQVFPLEFKTPTGVLSPEQQKVHQAHAAQGVSTHIIRSEEQFWATINAIITGKIKNTIVPASGLTNQ